ncbi:hypothetical protein SAMN05660226_00817 [Parapedobacter luteus]|uniref:Transmembrane protein n=1 Tax=Parapedobacter luteus TaxID=623280 RepID=A0A1T5AJ76_9SPHI|nr:hypothetical protein SAMN05660226_00817 [Parapedobacter luteus]
MSERSEEIHLHTRTKVIPRAATAFNLNYLNISLFATLSLFLHAEIHCFILTSLSFRHEIFY